MDIKFSQSYSAISIYSDFYLLNNSLALISTCLQHIKKLMHKLVVAKELLKIQSRNTNSLEDRVEQSKLGKKKCQIIYYWNKYPQ